MRTLQYPDCHCECQTRRDSQRSLPRTLAALPSVFRRVKSRKDCPEASCAESAAGVSWRVMTRRTPSYAGNRKRSEAKGDLELLDLVSVGPATVRALHSLGVRSVRQLARSKPNALYDKLCRLRRRRQDPCCLDVFTAAVAQARNPNLPAEKRVWWYWSQQRKSKSAAR
jgi:hypothetical protein